MGLTKVNQAAKAAGLDVGWYLLTVNFDGQDHYQKKNLQEDIKSIQEDGFSSLPVAMTFSNRREHTQECELVEKKIEEHGISWKVRFVKHNKHGMEEGHEE